jgi:hypothetical protein
MNKILEFEVWSLKLRYTDKTEFFFLILAFGF